jgi:hypothetical protein
MIYSGLSSFYNATVGIDFDSLEKKYNMKFPKTYKLFRKLYHLGDNSLRKEYYFNEKDRISIPLIGYYFGEYKTYISIENFIDVTQAIQLRGTDATEFDENNLNMIRIAFTNDPGGGGSI